MKKAWCFLLMGLFMFWLSACGSAALSAEDSLSFEENSSSIEKGALAPGGSHLLGNETGTPSSAARDKAPAENGISDLGDGKQTSMTQTAFYITVGETAFSATFADNPGAQALQELLAQEDITIEMHDYAGFEKVGALGESLPASDSQITTQAGDIVLYQADQIVIFYGSNSWSYTRLGRIDDLTGWTQALGSGDVSVTFSLRA